MWRSTYLSSFSSSRTYRATKQNTNLYRAFIAISFLIYSKHSACQCRKNEKWVINYCYTVNCLLCSEGEIKPCIGFYAKEASPCVRSAAVPSAPIAAARGVLEQQEPWDEPGSPAVTAVPRAAASLLTDLPGLHPTFQPRQSPGDGSQPRAVRPSPRAPSSATSEDDDQDDSRGGVTPDTGRCDFDSDCVRAQGPGGTTFKPCSSRLISSTKRVPPQEEFDWFGPRAARQRQGSWKRKTLGNSPQGDPQPRRMSPGGAASPSLLQLTPTYPHSPQAWQAIRKN